MAREIRAEWNAETIGELVNEEIPVPIAGEPEKLDEASGDESEGELREPVEQHRPRQLLKKARVTKFSRAPGAQVQAAQGGRGWLLVGRRGRARTAKIVLAKARRREMASPPKRSTGRAGLVQMPRWLGFPFQQGLPFLPCLAGPAG